MWRLRGGGFSHLPLGMLLGIPLPRRPPPPISLSRKAPSPAAAISPFRFPLMYEDYSVGDGFVQITENLGELVTYVANEPSVGLYYIQEHAKEATTNAVNLKGNINESSRETSLQTDDLEDSIAAVSSMKECGLRITDEMIGDIEKSLSMVLTKQRSGWMQRTHSSSIQIGRARSWMPTVLSQSAGDVPNERMGNYFSTVFNSAKGKAGNFKWRGVDLNNTRETKEECPSVPDQTPSISASGSKVSLTEPDNEETDELPLSIQAADEAEGCGINGVTRTRYKLSATANYEAFEADRKVRLEEWLKDNKPPDSIGSI